ncbi:MAG: hypothetical protein Q9223_002538 [Gallowayella weberi]
MGMAAAPLAVSVSAELPFHRFLSETAKVEDLELSKTPPLAPTQEVLVSEPQSSTLAMRVLFRVVEGLREKIWLGVPTPNSIPRVTATPLADTVILLHGSKRGGTEQSELFAAVRMAQRKVQSIERR